MFLPNYRAWVVVFIRWRSASPPGSSSSARGLGAYCRAATENPSLVRAFGINVPRMITLTYGFGVALAALAGVMAAPIYNVSPQMGANLIIVVFAVVVIGGMGSIMGAIVTGFCSASSRVDQGVLSGSLEHRDLRHHGDRTADPAGRPVRASRMTWQRDIAARSGRGRASRSELIAFVVMPAALIIAPAFIYPVFLMKALCFALFACAFNLLIGYVGLLSFGHALFFAGRLRGGTPRQGRTISVPYWQ